MRERFWSAEKKMFSEDLAHTHFSQHANVLAVLAQSPEERAASAAEALAFATNNLSIERTVDSIEAVYRLVTRRRGA